MLSVEWCACDSYALLLLKSRMMISYNLIVVGHGALFQFQYVFHKIKMGRHYVGSQFGEGYQRDQEQDLSYLSCS